MKRILCLGILTFMMSISLSQQDPQFSQSMFNTLMYNPGYAGSQNAICATALNRQQWVGFEGAPVSSFFSVNSPFRLFGADHGAGMHILNDEIGFQNDLSLNLAYAYRTDAGPGKLGIGLGFGMINSALNATWIPSEQTTGLPVENQSVITLDFSFGLFYQADELYIGFSSTHLNNPEIKYTGAGSMLSRHYYLTTGYTLYLNNPSYKVLPALFIQSDGTVTQLNMGGRLEYQSKLWGGLYYRFKSAVVAMAGIELFNGINIGYSYDFSTTAIVSHNKGTHEFMLRYCFDLDLDRTPQRYRSIRIL